MRSKLLRILCLDSSERRRFRLHAELENAGFDVVMTRDIEDALSLASRLQLDVVVADQPSTVGHEENWENFMSSHKELPVLLHSSGPRPPSRSPGTGEFAAVRTSNPAIIVAILTLLLGPGGMREAEAAVAV
jgi:hypothetical protein